MPIRFRWFRPWAPCPLSARNGRCSGAPMRVCIGLGLASSLLAGCIPNTQYRYSAFTPAARPIAWDGRTARTGTLRVEGTLASTYVNENVAPQIHDTALLVPSWTAEGAAMLAVSSRLEIGVRGAYSSYDWASPSTVGTMPVPNAPPSWGVGPEIRVAIPLDDRKRFYLGIAGNTMNYQVPYAEWMLTGPGAPTGNSPVACTPSPTCVQGYSLHNTQNESHWTYSVVLQPSYAFGEKGEYGHAFVAITATTGFKNDGFTNQPSNGSTVDTFWPLWIASVGYGALLEDLFSVSGSVFKPLTGPGSPVNYNLGFLLTVGVQAPIFEPIKGD